jgi:hypothetical protein
LDPVHQPAIATWDAGHPVLHHVDLAAVGFREVRRVEPIEPLVPLAEFAGEGGPAILAGQTPAWRAVVFPFSLRQTDLPLRVAFPVLLYNTLGWLAPGAETASHNVSTGAVFDIPAHPGASLEVEEPGGTVFSAEVDSATTDGAFQYGPATTVGFYEIAVTLGAERKGDTWAVSITNARESHIEPKGSFSTARGGRISAAQTVQYTRSLIPFALLLGLALVLLEWIVYVRRAAPAKSGRA